MSMVMKRIGSSFFTTHLRGSSFSHTGTFSFYSPLFYQSSIERFHCQSYDYRQLIIQCNLGFTKIDDALYLFRQLQSLHPPPSIIDFNLLFTTMLKMKPFPPFSTVISLSRELYLSEIRPDLFSLNILANCFCRLGYVDYGFSILAIIIKLGHEANMVTFNTLLNGLIRSHRFHQADLLLDKIIYLGFQATIVTYGAMFKGLCKVGNNVGALRLLSKMECHGHCIPDIVIYSTIIDSLCKDQLLPQALNLFAKMKKKGIFPDIITWASLLHGFCEAGQLDEAMELIDKMVTEGVSPNIVTYNTLLDGLCKVGQLRKAIDVFLSLTSKRLKPDLHTYTIMIRGLCKGGLIGEAYELFKKMEDDGCSPDACAMNTIITGLFKANHLSKGFELVNLMTNKQFRANATTTSLFQGLLTHDDVSDAQKELIVQILRFNNVCNSI
ncbi:unnamed protein product [Amaranthus hypochondriacus]